MGRDGAILGQLPPFEVATPWWMDLAPVVAGARTLGAEVVILRILGSERSDPPGGRVTYLAEVAIAPAGLRPWSGQLDDHPLRMSWARPGGPASDLAWAESVVGGLTGPAVQIRSWNLSSLWRLPTREGWAWLKVVPPFFAHEGAVLAELAGAQVPRVLAHDGPRLLMAEIPGEDRREAVGDELVRMALLLVSLQHARPTDRWLALGVPDWRNEALIAGIADVVARTSLDGDDRRALEPFVASLPERLAAADDCAPHALVHGDLHPGNVRGTPQALTVLDWGDCVVGHPLLDLPPFLDRIPAADRPTVRERWLRATPGRDPERAAALLAPVAAARQAMVYRRFLDRIEPSEQVYHRADPAERLHRAAAILSR